MEFYYENKWLSEVLPEGYYKNMYGSFTPMKLTLSPQEVKKYWDENPKEFHWARDEILKDPTAPESSFNSLGPYTVKVILNHPLKAF